MLSDGTVTAALEIVGTAAYDNGTKAAKAATMTVATAAAVAFAMDTTAADRAVCTFA